MSVRLMQTPNNYPFTHGWGVYPELPSYQEGRRFAAKRLLGHLDGSRMLDRRDFDWTMRKLEGMFLAVEAENARDWFTLAENLGQPSRPHAGEIRALLTALKTLSPSKDEVAVKRFLKKLDDLALSDMMHTYRDATDADEPASTDIRDGWCIIVWSDLHPGRFLVGMTDGTPGELLRLLDDQRPDRRHGLLSAWQVKDPVAAGASLVATFGESCDDLGLMELGRRETLPQIKLLAENAIWKLIVPSPWHLKPEAGHVADEDYKSRAPAIACSILSRPRIL